MRRLVCLNLLLATSCSENFMANAPIDKTSVAEELAALPDSAGNFIAVMDPNSTTTQVLKAASGAIAGSAIAMPAGALSIPVTITMGQGETLASSSITQQMGLSNNSATAAGPAVSFMPSTAVQASSPFTLSIPLSSSTSLGLNPIGSSGRQRSMENLVVIFKSINVEGNTTSYSVGIIPRSQITLGDKTVQFQTQKFGTFQLAITDTKITTKLEKATDEPPVLKADASNPLVGTWSSCQTVSEGNSGSTIPSSSSSQTISVAVDGSFPTTTVGLSCVLPSPDFDIKAWFGTGISGTTASAGAIRINRSKAFNGALITLGSRMEYTISQGSLISARVPQVTDATIADPQVLGPEEIVNFEAVGACYFERTTAGVVSNLRYLPYESTAGTFDVSPTPTTTYGSLSSILNIANSHHTLELNSFVTFEDTVSSPLVQFGLYKVSFMATDRLTFKIAASPSYSTNVEFSGTSVPLPMKRIENCTPMQFTDVRLVCPSSSGSSTQGPYAGNFENATSDDYGKYGSQGAFGFRTDRPNYELTSVKFTNTTFVHSKDFYSAPNCQGTLLSRLEETGSYTLGSGSGGAYPVSITMGTAKGTPYSVDAVSYLNANPLTSGCGFANWNVNASKDLMNSFCGYKDKSGTDDLPTDVRIDGTKIYFKQKTGWDTDPLEKR